MGNCIDSTFKEADTRGATSFAAKDDRLLNRLNEVEKFEFQLPFYRMRVDQYEGRVKRFVNTEDNNAVSMRQLRFSFSEDEAWADINKENSVTYHLFQQDELHDKDQKEKYQVHKLICLGLILCAGTKQLKTRVFYDAL